MTEKKSFTIRDAGPSDAEALIGLFNRAFNKQKDARTATWKYFDNPHRPSRTFLAEDGGVSGGAYSYVFRRMTWQGTEFLGTQASDAMVDVAFRKRGIFTTLDDEAARVCGQEDGAPLCFATAGRQSMHGFLKNGWREIGTYQTYVAVLDPSALLRGKLGPAASTAGAVVRLLLKGAGRAPRVDVPHGLKVGPLIEFDERFDSLWTLAKDQLPIAGVRDARYLRWRYVDTPTRKHHVIEVTRDDELVGYAVYEYSHGRGYVVDLLGVGDAAEDAALRGAMAALRQAGNPMAFFNTLPCARTAALLKRNGLFPHPRKKPFRTATPFIVRVLRDDLMPAPAVITDPTQWYVTDGDRDVEHMSPE